MSSDSIRVPVVLLGSTVASAQSCGAVCSFELSAGLTLAVLPPGSSTGCPGGRLDRLTWHGLDLSRSRIARLGFLLPYASTGGVYHVVWVVYDALRPFFVSGIDRELILSLPLERYADRLG
ncbi:hypothetical protein EV363DRAFT_1357219, partial [Boletus edulis]